MTAEALDVVVDNTNRAQEFLKKPLALEYITYDFAVPGATMSAGECFSRIVELTGCGILLDVSNLYINSVNHGFDWQDELDAFPVEHVVQVHLAGAVCDGGYLVDSHNAAVPREHWEVLEHVAGRIQIRGVIIERDSDFGEFSELLVEVGRANEILDGSATSSSTAAEVS